MKLIADGRKILCSASYSADSRSKDQEKLLRDCKFALKPFGLLPDVILQGVKRRGVISIGLQKFANSSIRQIFQHDIKMIF